jgi:hypothetical protein
MNLLDIKPELKKPFSATRIDYLPKPKMQFERDGQTFCRALPFADPRAYQDRLDEVCPGEWSTQASVTVAGDKLIAVVTVTICGVPHTDFGEASLVGPTSENAGTEAWAQAFKRACCQAGLGRYLYDLEKQYIPWDKAKKRFNITPTEKLNITLRMYKKAGLLSKQASEAPVTTAQLDAIKKLCIAQRKQIKPPATFADAEKLLKELQAS